MAELLPCPFCGCSVYAIQDTTLLCGHRHWYISHKNSDCILGGNFRSQLYTTKEKLMCAWNNTRTQKERGADKQKITCLNCKHLMFSDMYGECNKQLKIVNPSDTCEYAEPKERGGEK